MNEATIGKHCEDEEDGKLEAWGRVLGGREVAGPFS